jgi:hypothetical protein
MSCTLAVSCSVKGLQALDPDLPFLASEAAIDLDNLILNKTKELKAVRRLAEQLKHSINIGKMDSCPRSLMDPATLTVLGEAILQVAGKNGNSRIEDLLAQAASITEVLSNENPESSSDLEQARDFCVALSRAATVYRKSILDLRPQHPFRR